jgi:hypothetical protein
MNAKALTPILNVSGLAQSFALFERLGRNNRPMNRIPRSQPR